MTTTPSPQLLCRFCFHPLHDGKRCSQCKCKGKAGFWRALADSLGNAIGQAKWGGDNS